MTERSEGLSPANAETQELTREQYNYLSKQAYYFFPFLRKYYAILSRSSAEDEQFQAESMQRMKDIVLYYGGAFALGEFAIDREQSLIDKLNGTIQKRYTEDELYNKFLIVGENTVAKSDGETADYIYGTIPCRDLVNIDLPGAPFYSLGLSGGIIENSGNRRKNSVLNALTSYISEHHADQPVAVWGNVARGSIEAAAIHKKFEQAGIDSSFHLFRASSKAFNDREAFSIAEPTSLTNSWNIAVDTMSAGGNSVPMMRSFLQSLGSNRSSVYLTHGGRFWNKEMPVEFKYPEYERFGMGILLEAKPVR